MSRVTPMFDKVGKDCSNISCVKFDVGRLRHSSIDWNPWKLQCNGVYSWWNCPSSERASLILTCNNDVQPQNRLSWMAMTFLSSIFIESRDVQFINSRCPSSTRASFSSTTDNDVHPWNASSFMEVTLDGILMECSDVQFLNAQVPIVCRLSLHLSNACGGICRADGWLRTRVTFLKTLTPIL